MIIPRWLKDHRLLLLLALAAGAALRIWHLERWFPDLFEEAVAVARARKFWGPQSGVVDLNPHFFNYPGLFLYVQFASQALVFAVARVAGQLASLAEFRQLLITDYHWFVLLGRAVTVLFDLATVAVTFLLGRRYGDRWSGVLAASFVALNGLHVVASQYVQVDVPLVFFITLCLFFLPDLLERGRRTDYVRVGVCLGLAVATKYTAALLAVLFAAAVLPALIAASTRRTALLRSVQGAATGFVVFLVFNPFLPLSFGEFLDDFSFERSHMEEGHFGHDLSQSAFAFYAGHLVTATGVIGLAAVLAMARSVRRRDRLQGLLFLWIITYLVVISTWTMRADRYLLPAVPAILAAGAIGLQWLVQRRRAWATALLAVGIAAYIAPQSMALGEHYARVSAPNTRSQCRKWVEANVPERSLLAVEHYTYFPRLDSPFNWVVRLPLATLDPEQTAGFYRPGWVETFDYVFVSSSVSDRYREGRQRFPLHVEFYDHLEREWRLEKRFSPGVAMGPEISIYRNPRTEHPDEPYDTALYRNLRLVKISEAQRFLDSLGWALKGKGYERRAADVARMMGALRRMMKQRQRLPP